MIDLDSVWERIKRLQGAEFRTLQGLPFTYEVPGNYVRISRNGQEVNRVLSRANFNKALPLMPAAGPGVLRGRQGPSYTWAILMDPRVRMSDW